MVMSSNEGTLLSCVHDDCGCRLRVEVECTCPEAGTPYVCTCGAEMVPVEERVADSAS
jgi:hypothetical protein